MANMKKLFWLFWGYVLMMASSPAWANLPQPPSKDIASGNNDYVDVGKDIIFRGLGYVCIIIAVITLVAVAGTILKAYHVAHDKQDLGHFFKTLGVGLLVCVISFAFMYAGSQLMPEQSS